MRAAIRAFAFASRKLRSHSLNSLVCRISTMNNCTLKGTIPQGQKSTFWRAADRQRRPQNVLLRHGHPAHLEMVAGLKVYQPVSTSSYAQTMDAPETGIGRVVAEGSAVTSA